MSTFFDKLPNPVNLVGGDYEVIKTPTILAYRMVDGFPSHVWSNKNLKWLVPVSKNGVYELRIYMQLMRGLKDVIPNQEERREWIVSNMIYSFALTKACEFLVRRNYLGKVWNDMRNFMSLTGNVQTRDFLKVPLGSNGEVMISQDVDNKKNYVKFDCIVGNPPYQQNSGDTSDVAIYPAFVKKAIELKPNYLSMVIPAKWMIGDGRGVVEFLSFMISCRKIPVMITTENSREWFNSDIDLKGGAMYFLYDSKYNNTQTIINDKAYDLSDNDVIITDALAIGIKNKILVKCSEFFDTKMYGQNPYGVNTNHKVWTDNIYNSYPCHTSEGKGGGSVTRFISKELVIKNKDSISKWKLCIAKNSGKGRDGTGTAFIIKPGAITTQSYLVFGCFDSEDEVNSAIQYLNTRFAQFMSSVLKSTQNVSKRIFKWLPVLDFTKSYTDADLYTMFDLSTEEIAHIENTTKYFPIFRK
jgi:site-specific DNA-methyltransferase (adenine-specific)